MTTGHIPVDSRFKLDDVLEEGAQDYRWRPLEDREGGWWSGVLLGQVVHARQQGDALEWRADPGAGDLLARYFRLDDDIEAIFRELSSRDDGVAGLVRKYKHLRIIRQPDPWECTVAYICSANNSVKRISEIVEKIAETLGSPIEFDGDVRHTFPTPEVVLEAGVEPLEELELGLQRHRKIVAAAKRIQDDTLNLGRLAQPEVCYAEAKRRLMVCDGIGGKIADCIALFSLDKLEAFPLDRWVRGAVRKKYFSGGELPPDDELIVWAQDRFGPYAGYANQLLFREEREAAPSRKK